MQFKTAAVRIPHPASHAPGTSTTGALVQKHSVIVLINHEKKFTLIWMFIFKKRGNIFSGITLLLSKTPGGFGRN